ncbi:MAG: hypothetical protein IPJ19_14065 [Planctomycetes bacterium]|nr:hypothetical protein [Planctomycetota bacterium]
MQVAASDAHSLARCSDGSVLAWGSNLFGQLNVPVLPPGVTFVDIAAGPRHCLARLSDGSIAGWGDDSHGECDAPPAPPGLTYVNIAAGQGPQCRAAQRRKGHRLGTSR